jgi:NADH:ubiquinone oxidoreductase subunit E
MGTNDAGAVDLARMNRIFEKYGGQKGVLIPILQKAQSIYGYLPPAVLQLIADRLGVSLGKVYGVATFYSQFYLEPRGRHVLKLCDGTACHVRGTPSLATAVEHAYGITAGETSEDGELTMELVYCLGSCALAPVTVLDEQVIGRLQPATLLRRLKKEIAKGQKAAGTAAEGKDA